MNNSKTTLFFSLAALLCFSDISADAKTGSSIVAISGQKVIADSEAGKAIQSKLQSEQEKLAKPLQEDEKKAQAKGQKLQAEKDALDVEVADFEKNAKMLSEQARQSKIESLQDRGQKLEDGKRDLDRMVQKLQADAKKVEAKMQAVYQKEMGNFDALVKDVIKEIAQREGWDIVLMEEALVFVNPSVSKTNLVITELDKKVKALNKAKKEAAEKAATTTAKK
ncbi:MAG: OmpH family outer membrane protein [Candidatus Dependentiae bacterium]|nr:OmpH family outer membrane protein [Candidatus Dependentiae bacterium]